MVFEMVRLKEEKVIVEKSFIDLEKMVLLGLFVVGVVYEINNFVVFINSNIYFLWNVLFVFL